MSMCDPPIDAEFCADFRNVYFCIPILRIFRVMVILRPKKAPFPQTGLFRPLNNHNSKNPQDRYTKVYIFEISAKFCVDWWVTHGHLSNLKFFQIRASMVQRLAVRSGFPSFKTAVLGLNQLVLGTHIDFCLGFGKISKKVLLEQPYYQALIIFNLFDKMCMEPY